MKIVVKKFIGIALVIALVIAVKSCHTVVVLPQQLYDEAKAKEPYDAIIVPGFPHQEDHWPTIMQIRVLWSKYLFERGIAKNIIYSGGAVYTPYVESKIMALYGEAVGIPREHIFSETEAEYSVENLYNCYYLAKEKGFEKIALATDPFQTAKLLPYIDKFNLDVDIVPIVYDTLIAMPEVKVQIDASSAHVEDFEALTDRTSLYKRWRGTTGRLIKARKKKAAKKAKKQAKKAD